MKTILKIPAILILLLGSIGVPYAAFPQNSDQHASAAKNLITMKQFTFQAQSASPQGGRTKQLTYGYWIKVSGDTLSSNLPYYGKSYSPSASLTTTQSPLTFVSYKFDYAVKDHDKGSWDITINLKDQSNVRTFFMTVFDDNTASLQVNSNSLQSISFRGYITSNKQK